MECLKLLRKRVVQAWKLEETLSPEERRQHSWQFVSRQGGVPYLVGKGDANTFYYSVNGKTIKYLMPDDMFALMDTWVKKPYVSYVLTKSKNIEKAPIATNVKTLLKKTQSKYIGYYIAGITSTGKLVKLYKLEKGLMSSEWIKVSKKK